MAYKALIKKIMGPLPAVYGTNTVQRLIGFFVVWHLMGGQDGLVAKGWTRNNIWRSRKDFRNVFGVEVEDMWPELAAVLVKMRDE